MRQVLMFECHPEEKNWNFGDPVQAHLRLYLAVDPQRPLQSFPEPVSLGDLNAEV